MNEWMMNADVGLGSVGGKLIIRAKGLQHFHIQELKEVRPDFVKWLLLVARVVICNRWLL